MEATQPWAVIVRAKPPDDDNLTLRSLRLLQSCGASVAGTWSFSTGSCQQSLGRRGCLESAFMMVGAARRSWVPEQTLSSSVYPVRVIGLSSRSVSLETLWVEA